MFALLSDLLDLALGVWIPLAAAGGCFVGAAFAWLRVPLVGRQLAAGLVAIGVGLVAFVSGYLVARGDCQDATLRAQVEQLEADKRALETRMAHAAAIARGAAEVAEGARKEASEWKGKADALESELSKKPAPPACDWTRDERRRLLEIPVGEPRGGRPGPRAR